MTTDLELKANSESIVGMIYAGSAFLIWGLNPVYGKALLAVPTLEITMLQASLGYYIDRLVNEVVGLLILREGLRKPQVLAVLLATSGVLYLTISYGQFPWISLALALSFGL